MRPILPLLLCVSACGGFETYNPKAGDTDTDAGSDTEDTGDDSGGGGNGGNGGGGNGGNNGTDSGGGNGGGNGGVVGTEPFISEVMDGASSELRFVELYNPVDAQFDVGGYRLDVVPNGVGGDIATTVLPNVTIPRKGTLVICFKPAAGNFTSRFGKACDVEASDLCNDARGPTCGDGDDAYILKNSDKLVLDRYGENGTDGSGTGWDYTGKSAKRKSSVSAGAKSFVLGEWDVVDGADAKPFARD